MYKHKNINPTIGITHQTDTNITYTAITNNVIIQQILTGQSLSVLGDYRVKLLNQSTIDKNSDKYWTCVRAGEKERNFILQSMIIGNSNVSRFFISDIRHHMDSFDVILQTIKGKKYNIEVKLRDVKSTTFERWGDYISKQKYEELLADAEIIGSIPLYVMWFPDNVFRVYKIKDLKFKDTDFKPCNVRDYPGSKFKKTELATFIPCDKSIGYLLSQI